MTSKTLTNDTPDASQTYSLSDLSDWKHTGTSLAVLGHPIKHSVSPQMHNAALLNMAQTQQIYQDWRYFKFDVHPDELPEALELFKAKQFRGINLTIPHKVQAVELVSKVDAAAARMGAVNTLSLESEAGYVGYNSDGYGLESALKRTLEVDMAGATIVLLGAGGAARAAAVQCLLSGCQQLWIGNRNQERLSALLDILRPIAKPEQLQSFDLSQPPAELPRSATIINATSLGLQLDDPQPIDLTFFDSQCSVYDMIYKPRTALLNQAESLGMVHADGLSMLVWQGVKSLSIWSQTTVPAQTMMLAACHALNLESRDA